MGVGFPVKYGLKARCKQFWLKDTGIASLKYNYKLQRCSKEQCYKPGRLGNI